MEKVRSLRMLHVRGCIMNVEHYHVQPHCLCATICSAASWCTPSLRSQVCAHCAGTVGGNVVFQINQLMGRSKTHLKSCN